MLELQFQRKMSDQIINKVANSGLLSLDLEDWYVPGDRKQIDLKENLFQGFILKEKDFRKFLKEKDFEEFRGVHVAIICSEDVIIPTWAYMLYATKLSGIAQTVVFGDLDQLEYQLYSKKFDQLDFDTYQGLRVVVKGCSKYSLPESVYVELTNRLMPHVKTLMFGEPCSSVPLYKKRL